MLTHIDIKMNFANICRKRKTMKNENGGNCNTVMENPTADAAAIELQYSTVYDHNKPRRDDSPYENVEPCNKEEANEKQNADMTDKTVYANAEVIATEKTANQEIKKEKPKVLPIKPTMAIKPKVIAFKSKLQDSPSPQVCVRTNISPSQDDSKSDTQSFDEDYGEESIYENTKLPTSPMSIKIPIDGLKEYLNKLGACGGFQEEYKVWILLFELSLKPFVPINADIY